MHYNLRGLEFGNVHGHEEHCQLGVGPVFGGYDNRRARGVGKLEHNLFSPKYACQVGEIERAEADNHVGAGKFAVKSLESRCVVLVVGSFYGHLLGFDTELQQAVSFIDEKAYTSARVAEHLAVDSKRVGVGCGNHAVVVGETTLDKSAVKGKCVGLEYHALLGVENHAHNLVFAEHALEYVG